MRLPAHEGQNPRFLQRPCVFARTLEGEQHLMRAGITTQPQKTVGENAALEVGLKLVPHIRWQTFGSRIGIDTGQKGFEMLSHHLIQDCGTGITGLVSRRYHGLETRWIASMPSSR
jgi:hypothetical protein